MRVFLKDLLFGLRLAKRQKGASALAVLALALGIGLATTIFSMINGLLWRGLPFEAPREIVSVLRKDYNREDYDRRLSIHDFIDLADAQQSMAVMAIYDYNAFNFRNQNHVMRYNGAIVSSRFFDVLGAKPIIGRGFLEGEDQPGAEPVVVLSYDTWHEEFNNDRDALGKVVKIDGEFVTIVGVMPDGFDFPHRINLWMPHRMDPLAVKRGEGQHFHVFGRLRKNVGLKAANTEINGIIDRLAQAYPEDSAESRNVKVVPFTHGYWGDGVIKMFWMMQLGAFAVLLIACANTANLTLARSIQRGRELAIRASLGASRARLIVQMLTESLALTILGALGGLALAFLGIKLLWLSLEHFNLANWYHIGMDPAVLAFVVLVTVATAVVSGLAPALQASRCNIGETLKDDSRTASSLHMGRFARLLVVLQIGCSFALLYIAGLMVKSVILFTHVGLPFDPSSILVFDVDLPDAQYSESGRVTAFYDHLTEELERMPEFETVSLCDRIEVFGTFSLKVMIDGEAYASSDDYPLAHFNRVSSSFFKLHHRRILEGRLFLPTDTLDSEPVVIVNTAFARRFWPNDSALGRRFRVEDEDSPWLTVVGVADDFHMGGMFYPEGDGSGFYYPSSQNDKQQMTIMMQAVGNPGTWVEKVRKVINGFDADLPLYRPRTIEKMIGQTQYWFEFLAVIFSTFGLLSALLAAVGVFGVLSLSVNQRTREYGVRVAFGALPSDVIRHVFARASWQLVFGLMTGFAGAAFIIHFTMEKDMLFQVSGFDWLCGVLVLAVVVTSAFLSVWFPARKAARIHPSEALRFE